MKKYLLNLLFLFFSLFTFAQGETDTNDFFKSNLKVYVVVAVLVIILSCIFAFLFSMETRLKELEGKKN
ncbi:MAG: CcmD family protein [Bacteroidota bacterium]